MALTLRSSWSTRAGARSRALPALERLAAVPLASAITGGAGSMRTAAPGTRLSYRRWHGSNLGWQLVDAAGMASARPRVFFGVRLSDLEI